MPDILKRWLLACSAGWVVPLVLVALPGCTSFGVTSFTSDRGTTPTSAVFCDIQLPPDGRRCATPDDKLWGILLADAAIALVTNRKNTIGLDDSPTAKDHCHGEPEAVLFQHPFPDGHQVCLDCGRIGSPPLPYADAHALCIADCKDLYVASGQPGDPAAFCAGHAQVSTNAASPAPACFEGACDAEGIPRRDFFDPRRTPEPVAWQNPLTGVDVMGTTLTRTAPTPSDPQVFDAGAASTQLITRGNGYVEFTVNEVDKTRLCGVSTGATDTSTDYRTIDFSIDLFKDGRVYIFRREAKIVGRDLGSFGPYQAGEKYRINVKDKYNGTAEITVTRVIASCAVGSICPEQPLYPPYPPDPTAPSVLLSYPLRVDTSFHEQGATLADVRIVRIH